MAEKVRDKHFIKGIVSAGSTKIKTMSQGWMAKKMKFVPRIKEREEEGIELEKIEHLDSPKEEDLNQSWQSVVEASQNITKDPYAFLKALDELSVKTASVSDLSGKGADDIYELFEEIAVKSQRKRERFTDEELKVLGLLQFAIPSFMSSVAVQYLRIDEDEEKHFGFKLSLMAAAIGALCGSTPPVEGSEKKGQVEEMGNMLATVEEGSDIEKKAKDDVSIYFLQEGHILEQAFVRLIDDLVTYIYTYPKITPTHQSHAAVSEVLFKISALLKEGDRPFIDRVLECLKTAKSLDVHGKGSFHDAVLRFERSIPGLVLPQTASGDKIEEAIAGYKGTEVYKRWSSKPEPSRAFLREHITGVFQTKGLERGTVKKHLLTLKGRESVLYQAWRAVLSIRDWATRQFRQKLSRCQKRKSPGMGSQPA